MNDNARWYTSTDGGELIEHRSGAAAWDQAFRDAATNAQLTELFVDEGDGVELYAAHDHTYYR